MWGKIHKNEGQAPNNLFIMQIDPEQLKRFKIVKGAHELQEIIGEIMAMDNNKTSYPQWAGMTKDIPYSKLRDMIRQAKTGKNPIALFKWLLKKER